MLTFRLFASSSFVLAVAWPPSSPLLSSLSFTQILRWTLYIFFDLPLFFEVVGFPDGAVLREKRRRGKKGIAGTLEEPSTALFASSLALQPPSFFPFLTHHRLLSFSSISLSSAACFSLFWQSACFPTALPPPPPVYSQDKITLATTTTTNIYIYKTRHPFTTLIQKIQKRCNKLGRTFFAAATVSKYRGILHEGVSVCVCVVARTDFSFSSSLLSHSRYTCGEG